VANVVAVQGDPPGRRFDPPVDHHHGRRLAAARRADDRDEVALGDLDGQVVHGRRAVRVALGDLLEPDHSLTATALLAPRSPSWCGGAGKKAVASRNRR